MRRLVVSALTAACAGAALLPPVAAGASPPLTVVGGAGPGGATVSLTRVASGELRGRINLAVRSTVDGRLSVLYVPSGAAGGLAGGTVRFAGAVPQARTGEVSGVNLVATLPKSAAPTDFDGVLVLRAGAFSATTMKITGSASTFPGVTVEPATVHMRVTDWRGPIDPFDKAGVTVLLTGPGVPALFRDGERPPHTTFLLRSGNGKSVYGRLDFIPPAKNGDPTVASGIVSIPGEIDPGRYTVTAPISTLSAASPRLTVEVEAGHAFIWAVLAVLVGAFVAGRRRRRIGSLAIGIPVAALYVVIVFDPTWGTLLDYAGALAAGFTGQVVLSLLMPRRAR
jgi:hypothetical protein